MNLTRIRRLLRLIGLLQTGTEHSLDDFARQCEVSKRTVLRDLDVLRESGVPFVFDADTHRYRIPGKYYLPPTNFTPEEALSLIVLCRELGDRARLPFFSAARNAVLKLENTLPARLRDLVGPVVHSLRIEPGPGNPLSGREPVFDQLLDALRNHRAVRIRYSSFSEREVITTRLSPYQLLFSRRAWYVIGRSSLHREVRTFNVGRVQKLELLDDRYKIPANFSLNRYLGNAWHLIPEPGPDFDVRVRFQPLVAANVAEVRWHKTQQITRNSDGSVDFCVTVSGLNEIAWWIMGYGNQAEVLAPDALRKIIAKHASEMVKMYSKGETI